MSAQSLAVLGAASQLVIGGVFVYSGLSKLLSARAFIHGVSTYGLLPERVILPIACIIIAAELCVGVAHASGVWIPVSSVVGFCLLASFAVAVSVNLGRGRRIDCHCRLSTNEVIGPATLIRIAAFMLFEIVVIQASREAAAQPVLTLSLREMFHVGSAAFLLFVAAEWSARSLEVIAVATRAGQGWRRNRFLRERR